MRFRQRALRLLLSLSGLGTVTFVAHKIVPVNATTVGFAYLLLILIIASVLGTMQPAIGR